jgi:uncharacterized membrane protein
MIMMSEQVLPSAVAQCVIVRFVTNETVKPTDILSRLRAQFAGETLSRTQVYDWRKSFRESRTKVENMTHARRPRTPVNQANAEQIDGRSRDNGLITIRELAEIIRISVGSVEKVICDELNFSKVSGTASVVWWLALKTTNTEVPGSIPGHSLGFF